MGLFAHYIYGIVTDILSIHMLKAEGFILDPVANK